MSAPTEADFGRAEERASIARWLIAEAERRARLAGPDPRVEVQTIRDVLDAILRFEHLR